MTVIKPLTSFPAFKRRVGTMSGPRTHFTAYINCLKCHYMRVLSTRETSLCTALPLILILIKHSQYAVNMNI